MDRISYYRVAVIVPSYEQKWSNTVNWALENIRESQRSLPQQVDLDLVWIAEEDKYLSYRMKSVLSDTSIVAIVGPISSVHAKTMAGFDMFRRKPMILPCATATEFRRMYANCDYVWHLAAQDIEEIRVFLGLAINRAARHVHLLARDDEYGETFLSWTSFVAGQMGCSVGRIESYDDDDEMIGHFEEILSSPQSSSDIMLFVPSSIDDELALDSYLSSLPEERKDSLPIIVCSTDYVFQIGEEFSTDFFEGIDLAASVESGFADAYENAFGNEILCGEAQLYDSFLLLSFALARMETVGGTLNEALKAVAEGTSGKMNDWQDLSDCFCAIRDGKCPDLEGASGDLTFKPGSSGVEHSTYRHWQLEQHKMKTRSFLSVDESGSVSTDILSWTGEANHEFQSNADTAEVSVSADQCWALLVAGTTGWENYRHQADVYAMYQLLRKMGYPQDHIITIAQNDIAYNPNNIYQGVVRVLPEGDNVYKNIHINYYLSDLVPSDIENILCGKATSTTREVFPSDTDDNVFVYWCGEGDRNELEFGDYAVTGEQMLSFMQKMSDKHCFRKLFLAVEACYSGSIGEKLEGVPGLLCITASNANETSKADVADPYLGVWLSNGFTRGLLETIEENPDITFYDLYFRLVSSTWGSHVCIYNENSFGSLYNHRMSEFLPLTNK